MNSPHVPANWWPDPFRRFELRYWDGARWTHHVSTRGQTGIDPPVAAPAAPPGPGLAATPVVPTPSSMPRVSAPEAAPTPRPSPGASATPTARPSKKIRRQVDRAGAVSDGQRGGGTLFTEPILVVNQKAKMIDVNAEYAVYDQHGHRIGAVREVGQSRLRNAVSVRHSSTRAKRLHVLDGAGQIVLTLQRPQTMTKSTVTVRRPDGTEVGQIVQKTLGVFGKVRFDLVIGGRTLGSILAESWGVWDFSIQDTSGTEIGRITKGRGFGRGQTSSKRDKYVVEIAAAVEGPMRALAVAAALAVDTALREQ